jgi:hypothetical protein
MDHDRSAVLARTSVACARVAAVTTYGRRPDTHLTTPAAVCALDDGSVDIALRHDAPAARRLALRPLASVRVCPQWYEPVVLHGAVHRRPGFDDSGRVVFNVAVGAVRIGHDRRVVTAEQYVRASPDPLRHDADAVLRHLNAGHTDALLACVRARGAVAGFVEAAALDCEGLTLLAVSDEGVSPLRLAFPQPVTTLDELPGGLRAVLQPRCGCCSGRRDAPR